MPWRRRSPRRCYKGGYTGLLKVFLDQFPAGALADVVGVPVAVAASPAHAQAAASALHELVGELGAQLPAPPLAALEPRLAAVAEVAEEWADRAGDAYAPAIEKASAS
jgi:FMN reductase